MELWVLQKISTYDKADGGTNVHTDYRTAENPEELTRYINKFRYRWYDDWGYDVEDSDINGDVVTFFDDVDKLLDHVKDLRESDTSDVTSEMILAQCKHRGLAVQIRIARVRLFSELCTVENQTQT